jgi:hypothetical protein
VVVQPKLDERYGVIRRSSRRWWFYFWAGGSADLLFIFFIQPLLIDPIEKVLSHAGLTIPRIRSF